ncbi:hypothetical protein NDU88_007825 [Pleurodeles waltl]|uniref:Uncharacterized protein n=1 Tax=Pleurodeles waltl TaxID=8319 RepID=A0AAV7NU96_PLEWA|nr:hypothetical protein NDU88_007825 [Pleurodeles waltl]
MAAKLWEEEEGGEKQVLDYTQQLKTQLQMVWEDVPVRDPGPGSPRTETRRYRWEWDRGSEVGERWGETRESGVLHQDTERREDAESGGEMLEGRESPGRREALKEGSGTEGQWWEGDSGESRDSGLGFHQDPERGEDAESGGEVLEGRESPGRREARKEGSGTEQQSLIPRAGPEGSTQTPGEEKSRRRTCLPSTGKKEE